MIKTKDIKKHFTYGFEIEGKFDHKLCRRIERIYGTGCKDDGSVDVDTDDWNYDCDDWNGEEFAIGIFKSFGGMIRVLKWFKNNENYLENKSCGIHVHIKPKKDKIDNLMRCMIGDYEFIQNLQNFAKNHLCNEVKHRLTSSIFCRPYLTFPTTIREWNGQKKYAFIGNHPIGTFEFRFFSTCEHKVKNITTFFDYFFNELAKIKPKKSRELDIKSQKTRKMMIDNIIKRKSNETVKEKYLLSHPISTQRLEI